MDAEKQAFCANGNFHSWQHDKKTSFAASPIDTARPRENQTREKRQVGAPKRPFRARLLQFSTLCSFKIDDEFSLEPENWQHQVSCEASVNFQHIAKMPRLITLSPLDAALPMHQKTRNRTRLKCCACHEK